MKQNEEEIGRFTACCTANSVQQQIPGAEHITDDPHGIAGFATGSDGLPLHCAISVASWGSLVSSEASNLSQNEVFDSSQNFVLDSFVLRLHGTLDVYAEPFLKARIRRLIEKHGMKRMILDLTYCEFADSTGLIQLVLIYRDLKQVGGQLRLTHLSPKTKATFKTIGFDNLIAAME